MKAVNDGEIQVGVIYHYYWYQDQAESGDEQLEHRAALLRQPGPGRVRQRLRRRRARSRATHPAEAQQLVEFLTGKAGQQVLADSTALEYTVGQRRAGQHGAQAARRARRRRSSIRPSSTARR